MSNFCYFKEKISPKCLIVKSIQNKRNQILFPKTPNAIYSRAQYATSN